MQITFNVPDEVARALAPEGKEPARVALEALALEGYRSEVLSESDVRRLLGFPTRLQVHEFLKGHGVYLQYGLDDLEQDLESSRKLNAAIQEERSSSHRH